MKKTISKTVLCILLIFTCLQAIPTHAETPIGYDISGFSSTDIYGTPYSWNDVAGDNYTLIMLWSQFYGNSPTALKNMQRVRDEYAQQGISVLCMLWETEQTYAHLAWNIYNENKLDITTLRFVYSPELKGLVNVSYGSMPVYYLVDKNGIVISYSPGYLTYDRICDFINIHMPDYHLVQFFDMEGTMIFESVAKTGSDVYPPSPLVHDGFAFMYWNGDYLAVNSDRRIFAVYGILGDVNSDACINTGDVVRLLRHCADVSPLAQTSLGVSDYNLDGSVNTGDVVALLRYCIDSSVL